MWCLLELTYFSMSQLSITGQNLCCLPYTTFIWKRMTCFWRWFIGTSFAICGPLCYCYYNGFCSGEIRRLIPVNHVFLCRTMSDYSYMEFLSWKCCNFLKDEKHKIQIKSSHVFASDLKIKYFTLVITNLTF